MEILEKAIFEYLLCYLAQCFIIMLGVYAFCKKKLAMPQYLVAVAMLFFCAVIIRKLLPISFGVHTLFIMMVTVLVSIWYLKFPINSSVRSGIYMTLILLLGEIINILFLNVLLGKERFVAVMGNSVTKFVYAIPSTVIALLITLFYYLAMQKKLFAATEEKNHPNGTNQ